MKVKGIAVDLEGTLIDVEFAHHQGHILAAKDIGLILTMEECLEKIPHFVGGPGTEIAKEIAQLAVEGDAEYVFNRSDFHYNELVKTLPIQLRPGAMDVFQEIKRGNLEMAVGSLTPNARADLLLKKTGVKKIFGKSILLREDVRHVKPDPEVYIKTAGLMGIKPEEQLVFEDSPYGIIAARAAGSIAIGMPVIHEKTVIRNLIDAGAARIFWDWREMNFQRLINNLENINET